MGLVSSLERRGRDLEKGMYGRFGLASPSMPKTRGFFATISLNLGSFVKMDELSCSMVRLGRAKIHLYVSIAMDINRILKVRMDDKKFTVRIMEFLNGRITRFCERRLRGKKGPNQCGLEILTGQFQWVRPMPLPTIGFRSYLETHRCWNHDA